jgi:hypothetical protein
MRVEATGLEAACRLSFFLSRVAYAKVPAEKLSAFIGETGTQRDCAEKESWN